MGITLVGGGFRDGSRIDFLKGYYFIGGESTITGYSIEAAVGGRVGGLSTEGRGCGGISASFTRDFADDPNTSVF